jgi:hypothetical protein
MIAHVFNSAATDSLQVSSFVKRSVDLASIGPSKRILLPLFWDVVYKFIDSISCFPFVSAASRNVIPAKAGIQKSLTRLDSRLRESDKPNGLCNRCLE